MMIVKFADYEQLTPAIADEIKRSFACSPEYVDGIFAKRGAKEWAESVSGLNALLAALKEAGINASEVKIKRLESGKPVFENVPYYFNISHSCGRAVCVLSDVEVGVDIEFIKKVRSFDLIADNFFSDHEIEVYRAAKKPQEEFYRIWTRKESLLKLYGGGIEYKKLKDEDTCSHKGVSFVEYKRGLYLVNVCVAEK